MVGDTLPYQAACGGSGGAAYCGWYQPPYV